MPRIRWLVFSGHGVYRYMHEGQERRDAKPNSVTSICCRFVIQLVVQQIELVEFGTYYDLEC